MELARFDASQSLQEIGDNGIGAVIFPVPIEQGLAPADIEANAPQQVVVVVFSSGGVDKGSQPGKKLIFGAKVKASVVFVGERAAQGEEEVRSRIPVQIDRGEEVVVDISLLLSRRRRQGERLQVEVTFDAEAIEIDVLIFAMGGEQAEEEALWFAVEKVQCGTLELVLFPFGVGTIELQAEA